MDPLESRLGRFAVTAHLFRLVDELPRDKQLILLKQQVGERLPSHLFKMIIEMPEQQRQQLSEHLETATAEEGPVTTLHLDDETAPIRQIQRKPCHLRAICVVNERTFESVITDISTEGMFIQAPADYPPNTPIRLSVRFPGREKALLLRGEILRSETGGIGVRLIPLTPDQAEVIRNFLLNRE